MTMSKPAWSHVTTCKSSSSPYTQGPHPQRLSFGNTHRLIGHALILQAIIKPQYVDHIPKAVRGNVREVLESKDQRDMKESLLKDLDLEQVNFLYNFVHALCVVHLEQVS